MSGFEHLYVSSSLFEDYDLVLSLSPPPHPPTPGAKDEKRDPGCTLVQWTFQVPVVMLPMLEYCHPFSVLFRGTEYTALLGTS